MRNLKLLRKEIDVIDSEILGLLNRRMGVVKEVGLFKKENHVKPLAPKRWEEVLSDKVLRGEGLGLSRELIIDIWESIHKAALKLEESI